MGSKIAVCGQFLMKTIFNAFWHGPPLNVFHWACMRSFIRRGHDFRLYVYEPMEVPDGVKLMDAAEILPKDSLFFFNNPASGRPDLGPFSDLFRFKLLLLLGGWYVDIDTVCMADEFPAEPIRAWAQENPRTHPPTINGAQMALPKNDPLAKELYERCLARSQNYRIREDLGPNLLTEVIPKLGLPPSMFGTSETFYPIDWIGAFKFVLPRFRSEVEQKASTAYFLAVYQSFFQYCGIDLARTPPKNSYLRGMYETLSPERMTSDEYCVDEVISRVRDYILRNHDWAISQVIETTGPEIVEYFNLISSEPT